MINSAVNGNLGSKRRPYELPTVAFVAIKPEERLMSCNKASPDVDECLDPAGNPDFGS